MAGQTAGPIETKLDTRTHVHPGSVSGKVNVKVIHVCMREWQKHPERCANTPPSEQSSGWVRTPAAAPPSERLRNASRITQLEQRTRRLKRGAEGAEQRAAQPRAELRPEDR